MYSDDADEQNYDRLEWNYANLQEFYTRMIDVAVRESGYDVDVDMNTSETLLSEIFKSYSSNALDALPEDYLETAFGSPKALAEALVNTDLFILINNAWPNANTGNTAGSVSEEEWSQNNEVELPVV
jgi:hypothetical protein